ncbi:MAG TPA: hypothetical protein PKC37_09990 [Kaistella sp.]|jgi:hypothetical protein|nr:hypothetical protein [Flavobacteriales bacterium]MCA0390421.1 hypothetical protein [Bacteroidota bacterium]HMU08231.1 hypothetical protein [Kaistella sp.]HOB24868.1 hypothetical protein [Kaistella sp.]HPZ25338.1 hypothetical protein [Kaistella sp.]
MNITIKLDDDVDLTFFKKMLSQIKGVREVKIEDEFQILEKAIQKSRSQIQNGESKEYSKELLDSIFHKK